MLARDRIRLETDENPYNQLEAETRLVGKALDVLERESWIVRVRL